VNEAERCFAGDEDELSLFLQDHVGGAEQNVVADSVRDASKRSGPCRE
jgi:hypothetical protein